MKLLTRSAVLVLLVAAIYVGPAGAQINEGDDRGLRADVVRVAIRGAENNLTPFTLTFGSFPATNDLIHLPYDSLFWSQVKADPEPWLAESAESNADGSEWTVTLRDDVVWHDGAPFTSADVQFSFDYYVANGGSAGRYAHHVFDVPDFDRSEIVDDYTIKLYFNSPAPQFKIMPGADLPIVPKHIWETIADPSTAGDMLPIGTGPYKVVDIQPDQSYRLEANENYFKGKPTVDVLELVVIKDPAAAFAALQAGDIDMVERNVPPELLDQFTSSSEIQIKEGTRLESTQFYFNARKPPLDDPILRKAITMSFDLDAVVDTVLLGLGEPGRDTFLHPASAWAVDQAGHDFDVAGANTMLDDAGYLPSEPGALRQTPDGQPLSFRVLVNSFEPGDLRAVQLLAEQTQLIGVELTAEPLEPTALRAARRAPDGEIPTFDAYVANLEAHAHVDPDALYYFFHSPGPKGFGGAITGYTNPEFDAIAEEASRSQAPERLELDAQLQELLARDMPVQVLYYPDGIWAFRPDAYNGWLSDPGQGIFTVRSFLPSYVDDAAGPVEAVPDDTPATSEPTEGSDGSVDAGTAAAPSADSKASDSNTGALVGVGVAAVAAAGIALALARRRRDPADDTM